MSGLSSASVPGFQSPGVGFEAPFDMLEACHQRVHRILALLERLWAHAEQNGCDAQVQQAVHDVMRYFDLAAPLHHQDEELHVFPAVLAGGDAQGQAAVSTLGLQHRQMEQLWGVLREALVRMREPSEHAQPNPLEEEHVRAFVTLYRAHVVLEEGLVYLQARALMDPVRLHAASQDMMLRRGVPRAAF